jgi:hypothetical protein
MPMFSNYLTLRSRRSPLLGDGWARVTKEIQFAPAIPTSTEVRR